MEKYILELITENNRVIIPNFGAFIISKEPEISILFNNFLSFNDGLLVNYVAEKKDIDTIIATDLIFDYVDQLKKELDETGTYSINRVGVFKKDDNGILRFQQAEDFNEYLVETEPKETLDQKEQYQKKDTLLDIDDDISSEQVDEQHEDIIHEDDYSTEDESHNLLTIDTEPENIISASNEDHSVKDAIKTKDEDDIVIEKTKPDDPKQVSKTDSNDYAQKVIQEKKRIGIIIFIAIASIVIIGLAIYFIFFRHSNEDKKVKIPVKVAEKPISKEPVKKDTIEVFVKEPLANQKPAIEPIVNTKGLTHIIVGGFKEEDNAINMVEKLRKSGYKNAQIITKGTMYLVSIDSDVSYQKMEDMQQLILENEKLESWMYQVK